MTRIFGHFIAWKDDQGEYLKIGFSRPLFPFSSAGAIMGSPPIFLPITSAHSFPVTIMRRPSARPRSRVRSVTWPMNYWKML